MSSSQLLWWLGAVVVAAMGAYLFVGAVGLVPLPAAVEGSAVARTIAGVLGLVAGIGAPYAAAALRASLARPESRDRSSHLVLSDERGIVVLDRKGVTSMAQAAAEQTTGVQHADVVVEPAGNAALRVRARIDVRMGSGVKEAGVQSRSAIKQALEELGGLQVRDALVVVRVLEQHELTPPWHTKRAGKKGAQRWQHKETRAIS